MSENIHRILMSKRVAARFIEDLSQAGRTLTIFFPNEEVREGFVSEVKTSSCAPSLHITSRFDQATFMSMDVKAVDSVEYLAEERGFDWNDF